MPHASEVLMMLFLCRHIFFGAKPPPPIFPTFLYLKKKPDGQTPVVLQNFQGDQEDESKITHILWCAFVRSKWVPSVRRFHLVPNNSPCSLVHHCKA